MTSRNIGIIASVLAAVVVANFILIYFAFGGFEKYGPPINVVIPKGFGGVACGRMIEGEQFSETTWTLDSRGYFKASGEIQSHRPLVFQYQDATTGTLTVAPVNIWHPIYTENDSKAGITYAVFWVGDIDGWNRRVAANDTSRVCLGRFE